MKFYIFFNPETLEIKCQSDTPTAMEFPYIIAKQELYLPNWKIVKSGEKFSLEPIKNQYSDEEWEEITNPK